MKQKRMTINEAKKISMARYNRLPKSGYEIRICEYSKNELVRQLNDKWIKQVTVYRVWLQNRAGTFHVYEYASTDTDVKELW